MINIKPKAIQSLRPGAQWVLRGDDLEWLDTEQAQPTEAEITAEVARLQAEYDNNEYQRQRAQAYPSIADQLDTICWALATEGGSPGRSLA